MIGLQIAGAAINYAEQALRWEQRPEQTAVLKESFFCNSCSNLHPSSTAATARCRQAAAAAVVPPSTFHLSGVSRYHCVELDTLHSC